MSVTLLPGNSSKEEVRELFLEYTDMLLEADPTFKQYLELQNYEEELKHLDIKYGLPYGRLYLAYCDEALAGCIGLRKMDEQHCEMKRLYVRPQFRGNHVGTVLIQQIINDAKEIGYSYMLLDTMPFLKSAVRLYKSFGFYEIPKYNDNPTEIPIYMKLDMIRGKQ